MPSYPYYGYQPQIYQPPMADQLAQLRQQQYQPAPQPPHPQQSPIIWVQGEEAAKAYMVAAGCSVLLMDSEGSTFYLKSSDAQGMPMPLRIFDYVERTAQRPVQAQAIPPEEYVTRSEFAALEAKIAALSDASTARQKKLATKEEASHE